MIQWKKGKSSQEDALQRQTSARRAKLSQLTGKKNEMLELMEDDGNVDVVKTKLHTEFNQLFGDFCNLNTSVKGLLYQIVSEDEMKKDQQSWFEPKATSFREFIAGVSAWFEAAAQRREEASKFNEVVWPGDSVSATSSKRSKKSRARSGCSTALSVASSARLKAELEKAALLAKAAALKQRYALDEQELKVKAEKEQLELQAALAAADAQLKVLQKYEELSDAGRDAGVLPIVSDGESITGPYVADCQSIHSPAAQVHGAAGHGLLSHGPPTNGVAPSNSPVNTQTLCTVMQRQNEITECLVQQQRLSSLPPQNIPTFKGDPLDYMLFMTAFEHGVESRTEYSRDRLYFLEQYTTGHPRDLVQSCFHMKPDEGNASFCTERLMHELNLCGRNVNIFLTTMGEQKIVRSTAVAGLEVSGLHNNNFLELTEVFSQKAIPVSKANIPSQEEVDRWPHLKDVRIPSISGEIGLLIGANVPRALEPEEVIHSVKNGPYAVKTMLGWTVNGPLREDSCSMTKAGVPHVLSNRISVCRLEELWSQQFKYDFPEGRQDEQTEMSKEDLLFMDRVSTSAQLKGGHYCIGLPLKNKEVKMPNNRAIAEQRAFNLKKKLLKNTQFQEDYVTFMNDMITKGYAVKVPNKDINRSDGRVKVPAEDADLLRFLWWPGGDVSRNLEEYRMEVHLFGATSSPSCASYALRRCAEDNKHMFDASVVNTVLHNIYIDDCLKSVTSLEQALSLYHDLRKICQTGGFKLTKWISNSTEVLSKIPDEEKAQGNKDLDLDHNPFPIERALGVQWCVQSDSFRFRVVIQNRPLTRRGILSMVSSVYNPLGILAPIILPAKNILQELSRSKISWDDAVPENLAQQWFKWVQGIQQLCEFELDRCFKPACFGDPVSAHLHHFSDASEVGYGTVTYLIASAKELSQCHSQTEMEKEMSSFRRKLVKKTLTVEELQRAEQDIVHYCQQKKFHEEILALKMNRHVRKGSHLCKLNPVMIDGILRVGGRLRRAAIPEEAKYPAILPKDHRISELIVQEVHKETCHGGRNHVLSQLRQKYWIPNATALIRKVLSKCVTCRRLQGGTGQQLMADLPTNRVLPDEPPFTKTGVDYFGPFNVKCGRSTVKRYGVIFTCLTVRAVHIEMAQSLDTDSFIHALRRFIARRGQVLEMRSDNGTNFVGAERELKKAIQEWNTSKIENTLLQHSIKWMFNPPSGSHHGGVWERMIRSIRKVLNSTLRMQNLDEEGLHTFLCEAEAILNSRPITTPSNDPNDMEALTPNHLLLLKTRPSMPPGLFEREDLYARRRWRQVQYMADIFWKKWVREYLPELQKHQKWTRVSRNYVPGDIVLIVDESPARNSWVLGRVTHTVQDEHGLVRRVRVKTNTSELDRSITKICLLQATE
ncbi:hypothetical protein SRHO_G00180720 [Serrasalmus rhombeus]